MVNLRSKVRTSSSMKTLNVPILPILNLTTYSLVEIFQQLGQPYSSHLQVKIPSYTEMYALMIPAGNNRILVTTTSKNAPGFPSQTSFHLTFIFYQQLVQQASNRPHSHLTRTQSNSKIKSGYKTTRCHIPEDRIFFNAP